MICRLENLDSFLAVDFTLVKRMMALPLDHVGLEIEASKRYYGGKKVSKEFLLETGELAVSIDYEDVILDNGVFRALLVNEVLTHVKEHKKYFSEDDSVFSEEIKYKKVRNLKELKKSRAKYAFTYLVDTAEKLGASSVIKTLFETYKLGVDEWLTLGDPTKFIDDINNEDRPEILGILNADIPGFAPKKFKHTILEQLTGTPWTPQS